MSYTSFSENSFQRIDFSECRSVIVKDFFEIINGKTLGAKVSNAIDLRSKGVFNDAMLAMCEINRDQVQAVRDIQKIIDEVEDKGRTEVIFDKYRQTFPFQIGLINGDDVLQLLNKIQEDLSDIVKRVHQNESEIVTLSEELTFYETRMAGRIPDSEVESLRNRVKSINDTIVTAKEQIINSIISLVFEKFQTTECEQIVSITKNLYLIETSSIETLPAEKVNVAVVN